MYPNTVTHGRWPVWVKERTRYRNCASHGNQDRSPPTGGNYHPAQDGGQRERLDEGSVRRKRRADTLADDVGISRTALGDS